MRFLYRRLSLHLENLCPQWQVTAAPETHIVCLARSTPMQDLIMLAIGLGFFALSVGYAYACDRL